RRLGRLRDPHRPLGRLDGAQRVDGLRLRRAAPGPARPLLCGRQLHRRPSRPVPTLPLIALCRAVVWVPVAPLIIWARIVSNRDLGANTLQNGDVAAPRCRPGGGGAQADVLATPSSETIHERADRGLDRTDV